MTGRQRVAHSYPAYPGLIAENGENPARFLSPAVNLDPRPRIRGIEDHAVLNTWRDVAIDLDVDEEILAAIETRQDELFAAEAREAESHLREVWQLDSRDDLDDALQEELDTGPRRTVVSAINRRRAEVG